MWSVATQRKQHTYTVQANGNSILKVETRDILRSWTAMDYAAIGIFVIGMMLIIADLLAVIRDRDSYPYYHYGYLLTAFIFILVGMMFMVVRLGVILRSNPNNGPAVKSPLETESTFLDDHEKPDKAD